MDLDLSDDESDPLHHTPVPHSSVLFDPRGEQRGPMSDMPRAAQSARERDDEDMWAELG